MSAALESFCDKHKVNVIKLQFYSDKKNAFYIHCLREREASWLEAVQLCGK